MINPQLQHWLFFPVLTIILLIFVHPVPGMSAPPPAVPTMPDRVVIHPDATNNTPVPPQEQPPQLRQQSSGVPQPGVAQAPSAINHTAPVKNRLGFPRKFSDTLELKRIARDLNNIAKLNEHFQRFGAITNIQVEELCGILDNNFKELTTVLLH